MSIYTLPITPTSAEGDRIFVKAKASYGRNLSKLVALSRLPGFPSVQATSNGPRGMFDLFLELVYHNLKGEFKYAESCALTNSTYASDIRTYLQQMRRWRRSPPEAIYYMLSPISSSSRSRELRTLVLTNHGNRAKPRKSLLAYCLENGNPPLSIHIYCQLYF